MFLRIFCKYFEVNVFLTRLLSSSMHAHISTKKFFKNPLGKEGAPEKLAKKTPIRTLGNPWFG